MSIAVVAAEMRETQYCLNMRIRCIFLDSLSWKTLMVLHLVVHMKMNWTDVVVQRNEKKRARDGISYPGFFLTFTQLANHSVK